MADSHTTTEDVLQYIGMKIMMGYMRLPELRDYYKQDPYLGTQLHTLMESKMFTYLEARLQITPTLYQNDLVQVK